MRRRSFLAGTAALTLAPKLTLAQSPATLTAGLGKTRIAPSDYPETDVWCFDRLSPGPEIRLPQGARLTRRLVNDLPQPTSVHWHGIRIDNAMDGVPDVTQKAVAPGKSFDYDFTLPDAGTYWYHSHAKAMEQVERGLYGALIVEEAETPDIDGEHLLILDDWRLGEDAQILDDFDNAHDLSHGGRIGNVVTTNGKMDLKLPVRRGDRLRLRLINAANARVFTLDLAGLTGWIMALDGMPLSEPRPLNGRFLLAPAQRMDLIVDVVAEPGADAFLLDHVRGDDFSQTTFTTSGNGTARTEAPTPFPPNPSVGAPDAASARHLPVTMEGGAMSWLAEAASDGVTKSGSDLASEGLFWALNGIAGRPAEPLVTAARGETIRLDFVNDTVWEHAMHLHGQHFHELRPDGSLGDFRDTTLVAPGQTQPVMFVAHNPGDWLLHCHMLGHHTAGMGTWLRVT